LQNRGAGFSHEEGHPNALAPRKRPYHTIIPAMSTDANGDLHACYGVMGGWMQPQGHLQVTVAMLDDGLDPQQALDELRFCISTDPPNGTVMLEEGLPRSAASSSAGTPSRW
jgi:gamma-glutamyltranspeptidase/glutathione hydrolase